MSNSGNTSPVRIVDKNGKPTTVHRRNAGALPASYSLPLTPPVNNRHTRKMAHEKVILEAARQANDEHGFAIVSEYRLSRAFIHSTETEVQLLAEATRLEGFSSMLLNAEDDPDDTVSIAIVYDPDIEFEGATVNMKVIKYLTAIRAAHDFMRGPSDTTWQLSEETEETRARAKRYVAVYCAVNADGLHKPTNDIADLALNANNDDYDMILAVLRDDSTATLERINFVLEGGPSAISSGAL
jgi:hypothetical protein